MYVYIYYVCVCIYIYIYGMSFCLLLDSKSKWSIINPYYTYNPVLGIYSGQATQSPSH